MVRALVRFLLAGLARARLATRVAGAACALGILLAAAGCGRGPVRTVVLADYDFTAARPDPAYGELPGRDNGLHWFDAGWAPEPDAGGLWSVGEESTVRLQLVGRDLRLHLEAGTAPALAGQGQEVAVLLDGRTVASLRLPGGWGTAVCDTLLRAGELPPGEHVLSLRPTRVAAPSPEDPRRLAVYLKRLRVTAALGRRELARWREWTAVPPEPAAWQLTTAGDAAAAAAPFARDPDVLLIVCDAAAARHLGCYGHGRPTTPEVDALAAEGVRLEQVYSDMPFTPVAVASLLTGLSFRDHHLTRKGQALADSFTTLPEILAAHGYFTVAYSDNPFVTEAIGHGQGFALFRDVWYRKEHRDEDSDPELVERLLARDAARRFGDGPVFAYLHLMPPHAPYRPGPEHDLFTDPDYVGDIDGSADQLKAITDRRREVTPADRDRLEALYDGNLHRADASVGRIVRGWLALGRDRELLLVVMSDHGEAFGEHGRFEHLTTVHDEMLHIPLVLWPQRYWRHLAGSTGGLYGIEDVMPLLLGRLGLAPPPGTTVTRHFLEVLADPTRPRGEIVARTVDATHCFGLRTGRWLAFYDRLGQELYDLREDPAARVNLRGERPEQWRRLVGRLRAILAAGGGAAGAAAELSPEQERALEALGY